MRTTTITEAKNRLSALIDLVRAGESVLITDRGRAVATIGPVASSPDTSLRLPRLQRAGLVRVGTAAPPVDLLRMPPPELATGVSAVEMLLDERRSGR
jgi:prevent-host-death family protein